MNEQNGKTPEKQMLEFTFEEKPQNGLFFEEDTAKENPVSKSEKTSQKKTVKGGEFSELWPTYMPKFTDVSKNYRMAKTEEVTPTAEKTDPENAKKLTPVPEKTQNLPTPDATSDDLYEEAPSDAVVVKVSGNETVRDDDSRGFVIRKSGVGHYEDPTPVPVLDAEEVELDQLVGEFHMQKKESPVPEKPDEEAPETSDFTEAETTPAITYQEPITINLEEDEPAQEPTEPSPETPNLPAEPTPLPVVKYSRREYSDVTQRMSFKDKYLDTLVSLRLRLVFAVLLTALTLWCEIQLVACTTAVNLFGTVFYLTPTPFVELVLASGAFLLLIPEVFDAVRSLLHGQLKLSAVTPLFCTLTVGYYLALFLMKAESGVLLFTSVNAFFALCAVVGQILGTKAEFKSFKLASSSGEKTVVKKRLTRQFPYENIALDGAVDELNSEIVTTDKTRFVKDFFKRAHAPAENKSFNAFFFSMNILLSGAVGGALGFVRHDFVLGLSTGILTLLFGIPAFILLSHPLPLLCTECKNREKKSTVLGESSITSYAKADVFTFCDTEVFGKENVTLKRMMLFGDSQDITKVLGQTASLFAEIGGPLDEIFSASLDTKVFAKNVLVEKNGICGIYQNNAIAAGTDAYMKQLGIPLPQETDKELDVAGSQTRVMYASENGKVVAKYFLRYSFCDDFGAFLPAVLKEGVVPLIYSKDPNLDGELLKALCPVPGEIRLMKVTSLEIPTENGDDPELSGVLTLGDKQDALCCVLLCKRYVKYQKRLQTVTAILSVLGTAAGAYLSVLFGARVTFVMPLIYQLCATAVFALVSATWFYKHTF